MKAKLLVILLALAAQKALAQCDYIAANTPSPDSVSYVFSGGTFASYGCAPIDPNYWMSANGPSVTIKFNNKQDFPTFRVWGMNTDDIASVEVNGVSYPLTATSASYDAKVVCGVSPGPNGVVFSSGNLVGANTPTDGNYSYQNIKLHALHIDSIKIKSVAGAGWGFAGVSMHCYLEVGNVMTSEPITIYPNPSSETVTIKMNIAMKNAVLVMTDIYGRKVKTLSNLNGNEITLERSGLAAGIYLINLGQDNIILAKSKVVFTD